MLFDAWLDARRISPSRATRASLLGASGLAALAFFAGCSADVGQPHASSEEQTLAVSRGIPPFVFDTVDVLTQRNDNGRTGASVHSGLNAASFQAENAWGYLGEMDVDSEVWAQPLYVSNFTMNDGQKHDVVLIATLKAQLYAYDANSLQRLWTRNLSDSGILTATPVIDRDAGRIYVSFQALRSDPSRNPGALEQRIESLNLSDGNAPLVHIVSSTNIDDSGHCSPDAELCGNRDAFGQRPALLLVNGILYVGFGGAKEALNPRFDVGARYRGQLLGFDAQSLAFAGRFVTLQPGAFGSRIGGGIWQGSVGPAADPAGDIYVATGNIMSNSRCAAPGNHLCAQDADCGGTVKCAPPTDAANSLDSSPEAGSFGNSLIHLHPTALSSTAGHRSVRIDPVAWFTPYRSYWHNLTDLDFGSAGPMLLPGTNQLITGGKEGVLYLLDRDAMKSTTQAMTRSEYTLWPRHNQNLPGCSGNVQTYQRNDATKDGTSVQQEIIAGENFDMPAPGMDCWPAWPHIHGSPIYGELSDGNGYMYIWPEKDSLKAYRREATSPVKFSQEPVGRGPSAAPVPLGMPGGLLSLSTDPGGGGVLFATVPIDGGNDTFPTPGPLGSLHAYSPIPDALGHLQELWNDNATVPYYFAKFNPPMIGGNRHVYVPTFSSKVIVYGAQSNDPIARSTHFSVPGGHVAAFHQNAQFKVITAATIGSDGAVHIFWEMNNAAWIPQQSATVTPASTAPPGAPITSIAEADGKTFDTFFVDNSGAVNWLSVVDGQNWVNHGAISDKGFAPIGAAIATAIQGGATTDLFVVGSDGSVNVFWKPAGATTFAHGPLPGSAGQFLNGEFPLIIRPGSPSYRYCAPLRQCAHFTAGSHAQGQLSLVGVDANGALVEFTLARDGGPWSTPQPIAGAPAVVASARVAGGNHAGIGGISFDVAFVGNDGAVKVLANEGAGWRIANNVSPGGFAPVGGEVTMAKFPTSAQGVQFFVLVAGSEGAVDAFQYNAASQTWTSSLFAHTPSFGVVDPGAPIGAALQSSTAEQEVIDYFIGGRTGVYVSYKLPSQAWSRPGWIFH